ncbi:hypothetical protein ACFL03_05550 [Thermodesulfobacteriota bacterium]
MLQCRSIPIKEGVFFPFLTKISPKDELKLTPAQQYAGEVLSYLMPLILGQIGNSNSKNDWATKGLDEKLDFKNISERMTSSDKSKTGLLVFDQSILGLTEVLYYYDKKLNLHKGDSRYRSIYPSPELIAIRLMLLQKIHRNEKINLESFIKREKVLTHPDVMPTKEDLEAINLNAAEMQLLKDVFQSERHLYSYLKSHFLIKAFNNIGVIETDPFAEKIIQKANYEKYSCRYFGGSWSDDSIKISFLPSMIKEFDYGDSRHGLYSYGFKPTKHLSEIMNTLKQEILDKTESLIFKEINKEKMKIGKKKWEALWKKIVKEKITFYNEDERPLVIYPDNARQVIQDVCPEADFSVIVMDKDIYLSVFIDRDKDIYPHTNRFYIDITDIKYSQTDDETDRISEFIYSKLKDYLEEIMRIKG